MKVVILCGGRGLRFGDSTVPKPMQLVGGRPLLWHIMSRYAQFGYREFVLCLGWQGDVIREWVKDFLTKETHCKISEFATGLETQTGGRLLAVKDIIGDEFFVTYGDCLSDIHIPSLVEFDHSHGKTGTITVIKPQLPWGVADMNIGGEVHRFVEKPRYNNWCNGGFMVLDQRVFQYIKNEQTTLEHALGHMALEGQLHGYKHNGFWKGCDTEKDRLELDNLYHYHLGQAPWKV